MFSNYTNYIKKIMSSYCENFTTSKRAKEDFVSENVIGNHFRISQIKNHHMMENEMRSVAQHFIIKNPTISQKQEFIDNTLTSKKMMLCLKGGHKYYGDVVNGKMHGSGVVKDKLGYKLYEGDFQNNKPNGIGALYHKCGMLSYKGEIVDNRAHGFGVVYSYLYADQYYVKGRFLNGLLVEKYGTNVEEIDDDEFYF